MSHPLEQRLQQVRRRLRGLLVLYGAAWVAGCVVSATILVGVVDFLLRFRDPGMRLFCTLTVVGLFVWAIQRYLYRAFTIPWHDAELARRLGRIFPALGDAFPSAVEFLHQREEDPTAGSESLRRAVVVQATAEVERINLLQAVRVGPVAKTFGVACLILCVGLGIVLAAPASAGVALSRLANPFGKTVWPQTTHLAILQSGPAPPLRLRPRETFAPLLRDLAGGPLPDSLRIHYRFDPESAKPRDEARITLPDELGRITRRTNVDTPFDFRFVAASEAWTDWCSVRIEQQGEGSPPAGTSPASLPVTVARLLPGPPDSEEDRRLAILLPQQRVERVASGQVFEADLIDAGGAKLPSHARVFYRWQNDEGSFVEEEGTVQFLGSRLRVRRENLVRSFEYRVEAGDDQQMPWIPVEVVPAPCIVNHKTLIVPPSYTGLPSRETETLVRALKGSRVQISATASNSLSEAAFCCEEGERIECPISGPNRRKVEVSFDVDRSTAYWFELTDAEGLAGGGGLRWEVHAIPDAPPTVTITEPAANVFVTPQARIPLRISVKDDLAVRSIALAYARDDAERVETVPLYERPADTPPAAETDSGDLRTVDYTWNVADLALQPGSHLEAYVEAVDDLPQTGRSETRRVSIITPEELAERIAARQGAILNELARVLEMQRGCRRQAAEMEIRLEQTSRLDQADVDQLRGVELTQRQVNRTLTAAGEGLPMHVAGLLADLDNNGIDNPDVRRRMADILFQVEKLGREDLPQITLNMTAAIKGAQIQMEKSPDADLAKDVSKPLAKAGAHQDAVVKALEDLQGRLAQWENYRQFHRRVAQLLRDQRELARQTAVLAQNTLGKDSRNLSPQELADGKIQSRRQSELARDLDRIEDEMRRAAGDLQDSDPLAAETLADALAESRRLTLSTTLHGAARAVDENRMGQAVAQQQQAIEGLERVLDILGNRREYELARLIRRLRQAEEQLDALAQRQGELQGQMAEAAKGEDAEARQRRLEQLRAAQEEIQKDTEQTSRQLERLSADEVAKTTQGAEQSMKEAGDSSGQGKGEDAAKKAEEARKKLEEAQKQLADRRRQAEAELAFEQLAQLEDGLKALRRRQESALEGTERLDRLQAENSGLSDAQRATLTGLAREQALLLNEIQRTRDDLAAAAVFQLVLGQTADDMGTARDLLVQQQTGSPTQQVQSSAIARLDQIIEALQPEQPEENESEDGQGGNQGEGGEGQKGPKAPGDALKAMAELKLLKLMQIGINTQTKALEAQYGTGDAVPEAARQEYARLSREQGHLADLLLGLMQEMGDPEDNPDRLPTLGPDGLDLDRENVP